MIRVLVVEDEALVAKRIIRFLEKSLVEKTHSIRHEFNLDDAESYLSESEIDLLVLDLNLNGDDGFNLLKRKLSESFQTLVVSANTHRAIEAFEIGVLDFIPKPFTQHRIDLAIERAFGAEKRQGAGSQIKTLSVTRAGQLEFVRLEDILYIKASGHYSELHLCSGEQKLHGKSISSLLAVLPSYYHQVHRSYLVSIGNINGILRQPGSQYELELNDGVVIPLGRSYVSRIIEEMEC
ncbi:MAG: two-component system response regulator LytT [Flavobacteriales bacterium]|jgi:two-component system response regulator LytT